MLKRDRGVLCDLAQMKSKGSGFTLIVLEIVQFGSTIEWNERFFELIETNWF